MAEETQTLEQTLEKTDLGHVINENKKGIIIAAAVLVVLIASYSAWKYNANKSYQSNLEQVYTFQKDVLDKFVDGKLEEQDFIKKMKVIPIHLKGQPTMVPALIKSVDKLLASNKQAEALSVLDGWTEHFNKNSYNFFFLGMKLAPILENLGQTDKAIEIIQKLISSAIDVAKAMNYINLGRLYLAKGDSAKAKESFDFVLKNFEKSEEAKMAKLYLQQLK